MQKDTQCRDTYSLGGDLLEVSVLYLKRGLAEWNVSGQTGGCGCAAAAAAIIAATTKHALTLCATAHIVEAP